MKTEENTKEIILKGIKNQLIRINEDFSSITYIYQNITRNYNNPEEKVQAQTFCELILKYNYPVEQVRQFVKVTLGSSVKEADIIVYKDNQCNKPHIIVECKKETITEQEFKQAVNQAYTYAYATAGTVKYVWVTSGIKNEYYTVDKEVDSRENITDIPQYKINKLANYKFAKNGGVDKNGQKLFPLVKVEESELTNRFKQAHQALWGGGELNPSEAFDELDKLIFCKIFDEKKSGKIRACLKNHSYHLHALLCVIFAPNSGYIARYAPFIWHKSPTNCDAHLAESIFQTRSSSPMPRLLFWQMVQV
jgi:type I restriction enzyme M protein